jgi:nicotinate-nucleotide pyrophosphorylase (carboxylating)
MLSLQAVRRHTPMDTFQKLIIEALKEDQAREDITTRPLAGPDDMICGRLIANSSGILCGMGIFRDVFNVLDERCRVAAKFKDGQTIRAGRTIATVRGPVRAILAGERTALNFIQHLSGIATLTARFVHEVRGTRAKILDTRKTLPGLREFQKYAVRCGGGVNHRMNLADMALIKDNHLKLAHGMKAAVERIRAAKPGIRVEVECDTVAQVHEAVASGADIIMLDNMDVPTLRRAISIIRAAGTGNETEISGGVNLATVRSFARLGVDRISVGALTHSVPALDISLELDD